ncbi:hypothetical protein [Hafnia sp. HMSC23F03]|uniref:hypothetical protein n=1 Tax=Hafnia sp. HMSC23F03 TaxID=1581059 RepID=UPI0008A2B694|nr:hypothetical protein [Hafnia sp. HMSC23F03]
MSVTDEFSFLSTEKGDGLISADVELCAVALCGITDTRGNVTCKNICNHVKKRKMLFFPTQKIPLGAKS